MKGWLVNDYMTCVPNTRTIWHDLIDWLPGLQDKCNNGHLLDLPTHLDKLIKEESEPDYIIRNASYWPHYPFTKSKIFSILQDFRSEPQLKQMQIDVCNNSERVIAVSNFVKENFQDKIDNDIDVLPIGTNFDFFKPLEVKNEFDILPNSILWIGDYNNHPKGFDILKNIIKHTEYNFCIVLKSNYKIEHKRVRCFNRIPHSQLVKVMNNCSVVLCTSKEETLHLSSIEAAACNLPVVTSNIGVHYNIESGLWGENVKSFEYNDYIKAIDKSFNNLETYTPREYFYKKLSIDAVKEKWINIIKGNNKK